ncbi:c-type cytochrome [Sphingobacterium shayense]|uniref:PQQ-dependent sugar dehydrogenase n=1 Tax=Sphingobacterium shayense TaxID=626343 RepID=UPI001554EBB8|nr:PQQ-dependent sugar dehydrogenase [Sphingobacterium shayense]NQD71427.1 c-type cytochrome [Sphingobacterium shayense]
MICFSFPRLTAFLSLTVLLAGCRDPKEEYAWESEKTPEFLKVGEQFLEILPVADGLDVPWGMAYHENKILFTEIKGKVKSLDLETGNVQTLLTLNDVFTRTTPGLLDITIAPRGNGDPLVFINYTKKQDSLLVSTLMRYTYDGENLQNPKELLRVKGALGHNGSRLLVDRDRDILYWATGDAADNHYAQDSTILNGKVLRMHLDGSIPKDNPIAGSYVYAWGFRNIQGLASDGRGNLFTSEHGDAIEDEVNLILPLHNYGWPLVEGMHDTPQEIALQTRKANLTPPIRPWTPVIAPAGLAYYGSDEIKQWKNSLLLVTLKNQSLRVLTLGEGNKSIGQERVYFSEKYGRMRAVLTAPNGDIYLSTSNRDWNPQPGFPKENDDRILRLRVSTSNPAEYMQEDALPDAALNTESNGATLYKTYCASCHQADGKGVKGVFPALVGSQNIGDLRTFSQLLLNGTSEKKDIQGVRYEQDMASFGFLRDEQLIAIINYVNNRFGNGKELTQKEFETYESNN